MFCPECGKAVEEGSAFCPECGTKISNAETISSITPVIKPVKPMGITFVIFYTLFWGIMTTLVGGIGILMCNLGVGIIGEIKGGLLGFGIAEAVSMYVVFLGLLFYLILFLGIFEITAAYGLWSLSEWGRKLTVILYILSIPLSFLSLIGQRVTVGLIILILVGIAISVAIILYLSSPSVKRLFR